MPAVLNEKAVYTFIMKKRWIIVSLVAAAAAGFGGMKMYADYQEQEELKRRQAAYDKAMEGLKVDIDADMLMREYGDPFDLNSLVKKHTGNIEFTGEVDPMKTGDHEVKIRLSDQDSYGVKVEREFLYNIIVEDTKAPQIELAEETCVITEGDGFDPAGNVASVSDPVDGELPYDETAESGAWHFEGEYDPDTPGEYIITVKAADINGNQTEAQFTLIVEEKPVVYEPPAPAAASGGGNPYYIRINRALNTVTVYALNDAGDYEPYTAFICSTGGATPLGTYTTFGKSRWRLLYGPCYGQYATDIVGDILFHSVPYYTQYEGDLEYNEYNKLGTSASMGCVRLCVRDAMWIYNNCPIGTVVEFYDDYESYGPLGRPGSIWIDPESENRGWDPTDPSPSNPWNQ